MLTSIKQIVDGPDEVHLLQLGRNENKRAPFVIAQLAKQKKAQLAALSAKGLEKRDILYLGKSTGEAPKL
jgi:acyl-CoA dehydrogenase